MIIVSYCDWPSQGRAKFSEVFREIKISNGGIAARYELTTFRIEVLLIELKHYSRVKIMNLKPGIAAVDPSVDDVDGNVLTQPGKRLWTFRFRDPFVLCWLNS